MLWQTANISLGPCRDTGDHIGRRLPGEAFGGYVQSVLCANESQGELALNELGSLGTSSSPNNPNEVHANALLTFLNSRGQHECPAQGYHRYRSRRPCLASRPGLHSGKPCAILHRAGHAEVRGSALPLCFKAVVISPSLYNPHHYFSCGHLLTLFS